MGGRVLLHLAVGLGDGTLGMGVAYVTGQHACMWVVLRDETWVFGAAGIERRARVCGLGRSGLWVAPWHREIGGMFGCVYGHGGFDAVVLIQ